MKRVISIILTLAMLAGILAVTAAGVSAADIESARTGAGKDKPSVKLIRTSSDIVRGYYFEFTINGIPYRSDKTGTKFNQIAVSNMNAEEKKKVMTAFISMPNIKYEQLGRTFSGELDSWYMKNSGWANAAQVLSERLAAKNFPDYQERFGYNGGSAYFDEFFTPECVSSGQLTDETPEMAELVDLYKQEKEIFSWAKEAYAGMVNANNFRTRVAVQSLSGDLIQLICDRVLVPNITPAGTGGVAAQFFSVVIDYKMAIEGYNDQLQDAVLGKRVRADVASLVIEKMGKTIDYNELIIRQCCQECHRIQNEIDERFPAVYANARQKATECSSRDAADRRAVLEASPVSDEPDAQITAAIEDYRTRINSIVIPTFENGFRGTLEELQEAQAAAEAQKERLREALNQYVLGALNSAIAEMKAWRIKYYGTLDSQYTNDSVIGRYVAQAPQVPSFYLKEDLYADSGEEILEKQQFESYRTQAQSALNAMPDHGASARNICIEARKAYSPINQKLIATKGWFENSDSLSEESKKILKEKDGYLTAINALGGLEPSGSYYGYSATLYGSYCSNVYIERAKRGFDKTVQEFEAKLERRSAFQDEYKTSVVSVYNDHVEQYRQEWEDYSTALEERNDLLTTLPKYIDEQFLVYENGDYKLYESYVYNSDLCQRFYVNEGTYEDVERIAEETDSLYDRYLAYNVTAETASNSIIGTGSYVRKLSAKMTKAFKSGNQDLISGVSRWADIAKENDPDQTVVYSFSNGKKTGFDTSLSGKASSKLNTLQYLRNDFNGRVYSHRALMNAYFTLNENYDTYAVKIDDPAAHYNDEYNKLKRNCESLFNDYTRTVYSFAADVVGSVPAGEPDPADFVASLISEIDAIRAGGVFKGDTNGDNVVDANDVTIILRIVAGVETPYSNADALRFADIDGNGRLEVFDATCLQRYLAHLKTPYPIENVFIYS